MKSKEYVVESKTTAYKVRFSYYNSGSWKGKIMVGLFKLGPLFWSCIDSELLTNLEDAEVWFKKYCERLDELVIKEDGK